MTIGAEERLLRLGEPVHERRLALADARDADRHGLRELGLDPAQALEERLRVGRGQPHERAQRVLPAVEEGAGRDRAERALERLQRRLRDEHDVRLLEIAPEPGRPAFEISSRAAAAELLEEVLDQVLLGELLDHLHLLDPDRDLARNRATELDPRASLADEEPDELAVRDERHGEARAPPAARELRPELCEAERLPRRPGSGSLAMRSSSSLAASSR